MALMHIACVGRRRARIRKCGLKGPLKKIKFLEGPNISDFKKKTMKIKRARENCP